MRIIVLVLLFFIFASQAHAQVPSPATESAKPTKSIEYAMPYPGLLPDSPFYILKMARDRVVELLISDPLKQAEFDLLQSDKRIGAGIYLMNRDTKKANLSLSTIAKGQQYFKKALQDAVSAKKQGYPIRTLVAKLHLAAQKQHEVLLVIALKIPPNEVGYYKKIMAQSELLIKEAAALSAKEQSKNPH